VDVGFDGGNHVLTHSTFPSLKRHGSTGDRVRAAFVILKSANHAHMMTSGFITGVLPAVFGLVGTITGGLIAQRGTRIQRQSDSDATARAELARLTRAAANCVYPPRDRDSTDLRWAYLDAKDAAFIAMLARICHAASRTGY
jgi:hypothetical protein